jgi:hypothetical protein
MAYDLPSKDKLRDMAARQDAKAKEIKQARAAQAAAASTNNDNQDDEAAAKIIQVGAHRQANSSTCHAEPAQRNYRGYRERRAMRGLALSASTRWVEVCLLLCSSLYLMSDLSCRLSKKVHASVPFLPFLLTPFLFSLPPSFSPYLLPFLLTSFLSFLPPSFPSYLLPFLLTSFLSFLPPSFPPYLLPFLPTNRSCRLSPIPQFYPTPVPRPSCSSRFNPSLHAWQSHSPRQVEARC